MRAVNHAAPKPLVSVIVPVYNAREYLGCCLDSLAAQTYELTELIIVDDGSIDGSGDLCDQFASECARATVLHQENGGLSAARNAGVAHASGAYIAFVDADDMVSPIFIETLVDACLEFRCPMAAVQGGQRFENEASLKLAASARELSPSRKVSTSEYLDVVLHHRADMGAQFRLYRTDLVKTIRFSEGLLYEDFDFLPRVIADLDELALIETNTLYGYRMSKQGIIGGAYSHRKTESMCLVADRFLGAVWKHWPSLMRAAKSYCFTTFRMVFAQVPKGHPDRDVCWDRIREYRRAALHDAKARPVDRVSALVAMFGKSLFRLFCTACQCLGMMR